ncbi:MAG: hypothetical protein ACREM8_11185, partial [Vulcanimicrobiaceae bacterium]
VRYTWKTTRGTGGFDQFIQDTLNAKRCDLIVDVPYAIQGMLATHPYYVSSYVFVYPKKKNYDIQSMDSPDLRKLRIGYETDTPGESGLKIRALILHGVPFDIGDTEGASPREMLDALKSGRIAVAVTWEPAIGLYLHSFPNLEVTAVPNSRSQGSPEQYAFPMAMAVRTGDTKLQTQLNRVIANKQPELTRILTRYGVKLYQPGLNL